MAESKAVQQTEVGDGLALGVLAAGVTAITSSKTEVEFAFRRAWRRWPHASSYPVIKAGPTFDDIYYQIIHRSAGRRWGLTQWQIDGPLLQPELTNAHWTVEDGLEEQASRSGISEDAWRQLGAAFVEELNRTPAESD